MPLPSMEIPTVSFSEFGGPFMQAVTARRIPVNTLFELTYRCNFDCVHCYVVRPGTEGELTTEEVLRVLDELSEAGTLFVTFTGGEPLTRPDFREIYLHAKTLGLVVSVFTNAALVKDWVLDLFERYPPHKIEVTLYGASEETYRATTQRKNVRRAVLENVDRMLARGLDVRLKAIGMTETHAEMEAIREEAVQRGLEKWFRFDDILTVRTDCRRGPASHRLSAAEIVELDRQDPRRAEDFRRLYLLDRGKRARSPRLFRCGAATNQAVVDPFGRLQTCTLYRREFFDLRRGTVREGWDHLLEIVHQPVTRPTRCRSCDKISLCGSCPGNNSLESGGDPETPPDFLCEITFARVDAFCDDLRPRAPEPAGGYLPLHRKQDCQRPWLHRVREPVAPVVRLTTPVRAPRRSRARALPLATLNL